jgi:hypothetical protein
MKPSLIPLVIIANLLPGCTTTGSNPVADMPAWMGGLPADVPPRPGTSAYEARQSSPPEGEGCRSLTGRPHGFAALSRHDDSALE